MNQVLNKQGHHHHKNINSASVNKDGKQINNTNGIIKHGKTIVPVVWSDCKIVKTFELVS